MIDHVSLAVADLARSTSDYQRVLAPLGYAPLVRAESRTAFGKRYPELWLNHRSGLRPIPEGTGHHVCLRAPSQAAVEAFHAAALACGWRDDGKPGIRKATMTDYFGAFVLDPDGNKLEAVTFLKAG